MRSIRLLVVGLTLMALAACTTTTPGWTYAPASATPIPSAEASGSAAPSGSVTPSVAPSVAPSAAASAAPSGSAAAGATVELSAQNIAFDKTALSVPAGAAFQLVFHNNDAGIPHNVQIKDGSGTKVFDGEVFSGVDSRTYDVPSLPAGTYKFSCVVHPNMVGDLTAQ